jgi:hypothetical protein
VVQTPVGEVGKESITQPHHSPLLVFGIGCRSQLRRLGQLQQPLGPQAPAQPAAAAATTLGTPSAGSIDSSQSTAGGSGSNGGNNSSNLRHVGEHGDGSDGNSSGSARSVLLAGTLLLQHLAQAGPAAAAWGSRSRLVSKQDEQRLLPGWEVDAFVDRMWDLSGPILSNMGFSGLLGAASAAALKVSSSRFHQI